MRRKQVFTAGIAAATLAGILGAATATAAPTDVLFSNRGSGIEGVDIFSSPINAQLLEDVHLPVAGAYEIHGINLGYDNLGDLPVSVDVIVSFYDTVDYDVLPLTSAIAGGQIGTSYRFNFTAQPAAGESGLLTLPGGPILSADQDFGVVVSFVAPNTNTPMTGINHLFKDVPVTTGSSNPLFAYDFNFDGTIDGTEEFGWAQGPFADANLYMEIQGQQAVPEPATAGLLGVTALSLLRRRLRRA